MTPRDVDAMSPAEYVAFTRYALRVQAEERRALAKAKQQARRRG
jgi:hypothetical protein